MLFNRLANTSSCCDGKRIHRYVIKGLCISKRTIKDLQCEGPCRPDNIPQDVSASKRYIWRCVAHFRKTIRVKMNCFDGTTKYAFPSVVRKCVCKRYRRRQNETKQKIIKRSLESYYVAM